MTELELKRRRQMLGLTQMELAHRLEFSVQQISNYETGRVNIPKVVELALGQLDQKKKHNEKKRHVGKTKEIIIIQDFIEAVKRKLKNHFLFALLFGSKARGDYTKDSDSDILIVVKKINPGLRQKVFDILFHTDPGYEYKISPILFSLKDYKKNEALHSPFIQNIKAEGTLL